MFMNQFIQAMHWSVEIYTESIEYFTIKYIRELQGSTRYEKMRNRFPLSRNHLSFLLRNSMWDSFEQSSGRLYLHSGQLFPRYFDNRTLNNSRAFTKLHLLTFQMEVWFIRNTNPNIILLLPKRKWTQWLSKIEMNSNEHVGAKGRVILKLWWQ